MLPHEQLDAALDERRLSKRKEWNDVAKAIGIKPRSLLDIRKGRNGPSALTARAMDEWLGWPHGSVKRLLSGHGLPEEASQNEPETFEEIAAKNRADLEELGSILERALVEKRGRPLTETQRRVTNEMAGTIERTIEAMDEQAG